MCSTTYVYNDLIFRDKRTMVNCTTATDANRSRRVRSIIQRYNLQLICLIPPCAERATSEARHNRSSIAITGLWLIRRSPRGGFLEAAEGTGAGGFVVYMRGLEEEVMRGVGPGQTRAGEHIHSAPVIGLRIANHRSKS